MALYDVFERKLGDSPLRIGRGKLGEVEILKLVKMLEILAD